MSFFFLAHPVYICVSRGKFVKSINSLRFTSLFSRVLSVIYIWFLKAVGRTLACCCKFFGSECCWETV